MVRIFIQKFASIQGEVTFKINLSTSPLGEYLHTIPITPIFCVSVNDSFRNSFRIYRVETRVEFDLVWYLQVCRNDIKLKLAVMSALDRWY